MYGSVRTLRLGDEVRVVTGPNWFALLPTIILACVLGAGVFYALRAANANTTGDPIGEYVFAGLLGAGALGALAMTVARTRRRITVVVRNAELLAETRSLFTRSTSWPRTPDDYFILATRETHWSTDKGDRVSRTYSLYVAGDAVTRREMISSRDEKTVKALANTLATELGGLCIESVQYTDSDREQEVLDRLQVEHLKQDRDKALGEMKSAANQLEEQAEEIRAHTRADAKLSEDKQKEIDLVSEVASTAQREVQQAEFEARAQDIAQYEFQIALPGRIVEFARLSVPADYGLGTILFRASTMGVAILLLVAAPVLMAIVGMLLVAIVDLLPASDLAARVRQAFVDMFAFGLGSFLWPPVLLAIYTAWTWLKVDASFSPFRVQIDWSKEELMVETGRETQCMLFHHVKRLSTSVVHTQQLKESAWKHAVRLWVESEKGEPIPLLDDFQTTTGSNPSTAANLLEPIASELAESMGVPLHQGKNVSQRYDSGGFPFRPSVFEFGRIWRLASSSARVSLLLSIFGALLCCVVLLVSRVLGQ
ncbi:MAG: hypothetical protein AAF394_02080 [Planctomycetota bacterium]